jgi:hypothetical protein
MMLWTQEILTPCYVLGDSGGHETKEVRMALVRLGSLI